ncbi:MAG: hypothetical protein KDG89_08415 [Geminicoccaceae bacterium]|nr:hypothetical protein [Geminicoccaceae bacterium]
MVAYRGLQSTEAPEVLAAMRLAGPEKSDATERELAGSGMAGGVAKRGARWTRPSGRRRGHIHTGMSQSIHHSG